MSPKPLPLRSETMKIFDLRESRRSEAVWLRVSLIATLIPLGLGLGLAFVWSRTGSSGIAGRVDFLSRVVLLVLAALAFINLYSRSLQRLRLPSMLVSLSFLWLGAGEAAGLLAGQFGSSGGTAGATSLAVLVANGTGFALILAVGSWNAVRPERAVPRIGRWVLPVLAVGLALPWGIQALEGSSRLAPGLVSGFGLVAIALFLFAAWRLFLGYRIEYEPLRLSLLLVALGGAGAQILILFGTAGDVAATLFAVRATLAATILSPLIAVILKDSHFASRSLPAQVRLACNGIILVILASIVAIVTHESRFMPAAAGFGEHARHQSGLLVLVFVVVACTCIAMLLATLACRRFLDNVESLVDATRKLAQGKLESLVTQRGGTELTALTGAFNAMAERVFLQTRELRILARVMDGTSDPVLVLDPRLHIVYANDAFSAKTGWARIATIGRSFRDLFVGNDAARKLEEIHEDVKAGESWAGELAVRTQSSGRLESFVTVSPVIHEGQVVQYVAVHRDLSALKRLESERLAFADNLVRLHAVTQDLVCSLDLDEVIHRAVSGLRDRFGISARVWLVGGADRCSDCGLAELCSARDRGPCLVLPESSTRIPFDVGCAGRAAATGERFVNPEQGRGEELFAGEPKELRLPGLRAAYPLIEGGEVRGVLELGIPDNEQVRVLDSMNLLAEVLAQAIANARLHHQVRSQADYLKATTQDLRSVVEAQTSQAEELREANSKLVEAERLRNTFLSTTSHELRTPISGMMGYLRLILDGLAEDHDEELQFIKESHDLAQQLLRVINDVLDIAKIDSGRVKVRSDAIDVDEVLMEVRSSTEETARQKGLQLEIEGAGQDLELHADHDRLIQVLGILTGNAIKFSHEGRVQVRAAADGAGFVEFRIADEGIGLDPAEFERVLEPFVQADSGDRRVYGGNGLGLTLARDLLALMGGTIHLESDGPGLGVTAVARVPIGAATTEKEPRGAPDGAGPVVLLVDSDPIFVDLVSRVVLEHDGRIQVVGNAAEAFEVTRHLHPDFVLAEFSLPHQAHPRLRSGVDLAREVENSPDCESSFVLTTALDPSRAPLQGALRAGPELEVVRKPMTAGALAEVLGLALREEGAGPPEDCRVLLVDDDQRSSDRVITTLSAGHFHVDHARRGDEAIAALLHAPETYDVLLIDLLLPGMSLYEILETVSGRERFDRLAIVVLVQDNDAVAAIQDIVSLNDMVVGAVTKSSLTAAPHVLARSIREAMRARQRALVRS